ncbi:Proline-rich protein PRCC [Heterocephalus glaber]|uniref:Proline-rich protein PRCC n=1 Tax=Heterocephalus glaber TaxID=10181 RepID=G5BLQ2_HETGA|nr:Proline-rich protein PRCC [Heterocephalus glaber]
MEPELAFQDDAANAPLEFKMAAGSSGAPWMAKPGDDYSYNQFSAYGDANAAGAYYQKKGEQPTGQQRRKHQITYLIHQVRILWALPGKIPTNRKLKAEIRASAIRPCVLRGH